MNRRRGKVVSSLLLKENPEGVDCIATEHLSFFRGQSGEGGVWGHRTSDAICEKEGGQQGGPTWLSCQNLSKPVHDSWQVGVN